MISNILVPYRSVYIIIARIDNIILIPVMILHTIVITLSLLPAIVMPPRIRYTKKANPVARIVKRKARRAFTKPSIMLTYSL